MAVTVANWLWKTESVNTREWLNDRMKEIFYWVKREQHWRHIKTLITLILQKYWNSFINPIWLQDWIVIVNICYLTITNFIKVPCGYEYVIYTIYMNNNVPGYYRTIVSSIKRKIIKTQKIYTHKKNTLH